MKSNLHIFDCIMSRLYGVDFQPFRGMRQKQLVDYLDFIAQDADRDERRGHSCSEEVNFPAAFEGRLCDE